jgi:hypothetical protein
MSAPCVVRCWNSATFGERDVPWAACVFSSFGSAFLWPSVLWPVLCVGILAEWAAFTVPTSSFSCAPSAVHERNCRYKADYGHQLWYRCHWVMRERGRGVQSQPCTRIHNVSYIMQKHMHMQSYVYHMRTRIYVYFVHYTYTMYTVYYISNYTVYCIHVCLAKSSAQGAASVQLLLTVVLADSGSLPEAP